MKLVADERSEAVPVCPAKDTVSTNEVAGERSEAVPVCPAKDTIETNEVADGDMSIVKQKDWIMWNGYLNSILQTPTGLSDN